MFFCGCKAMPARSEPAAFLDHALARIHTTQTRLSTIHAWASEHSPGEQLIPHQRHLSSCSPTPGSSDSPGVMLH